MPVETDRRRVDTDDLRQSLNRQLLEDSLRIQRSEEDLRWRQIHNDRQQRYRDLEADRQSRPVVPTSRPLANLPSNGTPSQITPIQHLERNRDLRNTADLQRSLTPRNRPTLTGDFPNVRRVPDLDWQRVPNQSPVRSPPRWARNLDFGDASSPAEAVINDLLQQTAQPYFEQRTIEARQLYEQTLRDTERNFLESRNALGDLERDFREAIDNIPEPDPISLPSPSLLCRHFIEFTFQGSVTDGDFSYWQAQDSGSATVTVQNWVWNFETGAYEFLGESSNLVFSADPPGTRNYQGNQPPSGLILHSSSAGDQTYGNPRFNYYATKSQLTGSFPVLADLYRQNIDGTATVIGTAPISWDISPPRMFFGGGCTPEDQASPVPTRRPRSREREDDMQQCLAPMLISRLDRIIALLEHNVLTEAQIDQIAGSARGLRAQTKTLKAMKQDAIAAVPDYWQNRAGQRPQLVLQFARKLPSGKYGAPDIPLTIAHYPNRKPSENSPPISYFDHGNEMGILVLLDNSKLTVNCATQAEAKRVISLALSKVGRTYRPANANPRIGPRGGEPIKTERVYCRIAKYFSTGQKKMRPDWVVYFK